MQTLTLAELALFLGVVGGTVTFLAAAARALGGSSTPRAFPSPATMDPETLMERLCADIERHERHDHGSAEMGGIRVSAHWYGPMPPSSFAPWGRWSVVCQRGPAELSFSAPNIETLRTRLLFELREIAGVGLRVVAK